MANQNMPVDKTSFTFGLVAGIAIISIVLLIFVSVTKNKDGEVAGEKIEDGNTAEEDAKEEDNQPVLANIEVTETDHIRGNVDAPVTIIEFSDFYCPFCNRFHETMLEVMEAYPEKVRWVYKHFPLDSLHPDARQAGAAAECANDQDKFWEYADELYAQQQTLTTDSYSEIAKELKLDVTEFDTCLESEKYKDKVQADYQLGVQNGVQGTPGNFINGQSVPGAVPFDQIKSIIESIIAE